MALNKKELLELMISVAKADKKAPIAYSFGDAQLTYSAMNEVLRDELQAIAGTYSLYRENKNLLFSLIEETVDEEMLLCDIYNFDQYKLNKLNINPETKIGYDL